MVVRPLSVFRRLRVRRPLQHRNIELHLTKGTVSDRVPNPFQISFSLYSMFRCYDNVDDRI